MNKIQKMTLGLIVAGALTAAYIVNAVKGVGDVFEVDTDE